MKQFAVIGIGRFGRSVAIALHQLGHQVLALDSNKDKVKNFSSRVTRTIQCDASNEAALRATGIRNCEVAIVAVGSLATATRVIILLKELGIKHIVARADDQVDAKIMCLTGADQVVLPEHDMGSRLAKNLSFPSLKEYIEITENVGLLELQPLPKMINQSLRNLSLTDNYGIHVMAIKNGQGKLNITPCGADIIRSEDTLLVIGDVTSLKRLQER